MDPRGEFCSPFVFWVEDWPLKRGRLLTPLDPELTVKSEIVCRQAAAHIFKKQTNLPLTVIVVLGFT